MRNRIHVIAGESNDHCGTVLYVSTFIKTHLNHYAFKGLSSPRAYTSFVPLRAQPTLHNIQDCILQTLHCHNLPAVTLISNPNRPQMDARLCYVVLLS